MTLLPKTQGQVTFLGSCESYAQYPGLDMSEGLLQLTFRTSHSNGLILYAEGSSPGGVEALEIRLDSGRMAAEVLRWEQVGTSHGFPFYERRKEIFYVSEHLNDNSAHTLSLQRSGGQLTMSILDKSASRLLGPLPSIGSTELFIGGLPESVTSRFGMTVYFTGCLDDIQIANSSSDPGSLVNATSLQQSGIMDGCADPCNNVSCGDGNCVAMLPDRFFCDCTSTLMGGARCNEGRYVHVHACIYIHEHGLSHLAAKQTMFLVFTYMVGTSKIIHPLGSVPAIDYTFCYETCHYKIPYS